MLNVVICRALILSAVSVLFEGRVGCHCPGCPRNEIRPEEAGGSAYKISHLKMLLSAKSDTRGLNNGNCVLRFI